MDTVNIHEAKTHLSRLVEKVANGESIIIAKAGKPMAKLVPVDAPPARKQRRFGIMLDIQVPDDIDTMFQNEIERMFYGDE